MRASARAGSFAAIAAALLTAVLLIPATAAAAPVDSPELVEDINPGSGSSWPRSLTGFEGELLFFAREGWLNDLWRSDGTEAGTEKVADLGFSSSVNDLIKFDGKLFFATYESDDATDEYRMELWRSDGTTAGTERILVFAGEPDFRDPFWVEPSPEFTVLDGKLFFVARGSRGREMWRSDGTAAGTTEISDVRPDRLAGSRAEAVSSSPAPIADNWFLTRAGDRLFFEAAGALWRSDGSESGTVKVREDLEFHNARADLTAVGDLLFFSADDEVNGEELWVSDGTAAGTRLVENINSSDRQRGGSYPTDLTAVGELLMFSAVDGRNGRDVWRSDGTKRGTFRLGEIGCCTDFDGTSFAFEGGGLWRTDGTFGGTALVKNVDGWTGSIANVGGIPYFAADRGDGFELWRTDGTRAGTVALADLDPSNAANVRDPQTMTQVGETVYFSGEDDVDGRELWKFTPGPSRALDTTKPRLRLFGKSPTRRVLVKATVNEPARVSVRQRGNTARVSGRRAEAAGKRRIRLRTVTKRLDADQTKRFKLKPRGRRSAKRLNRLLRRGKRVTFRLRAVAKDESGFRRRAGFKSTLRR